MGKFRRQRQAAWDKRHLVTVSTHLKEEDYQTLRALCVLNGDRPYFIVRQALLDYIAGKGGSRDIDLLRSGIIEDEPPRVLAELPEVKSYDPAGVVIRWH